MSLRSHLLVIAIITAIVLLMWQLVLKPSPSVNIPSPSPVQESNFTITIIRASWGLNCLQKPGDVHIGNNDPFAKQSNPYENNVLTIVQELCNGKSACEIPISPDGLGEEPLPECRDKELFVEYRCFSYDRPWSAKSMSETLVLNCNKQTATPNS